MIHSIEKKFANMKENCHVYSPNFLGKREEGEKNSWTCYFIRLN